MPDRRRPLLPPPVLMTACAVGQLLTTPGQRPSRVSTVVASVPAAAALAMWFGCGAQLLWARTTVNPYRAQATRQLVTTGPNAISRNPMYLGMAGLLASHAVARRSPAALAWLGLFVAVLDRTQIAYEEEHLRRRFGDQYEQYAARVRRWI